ncbi:MAG: hypothetical protein ACOCVN_00310 [bacterium]
MQKYTNHIIFRLFSVFILGVAFFIIANQALYIHTHETAEGEIIVHAHPFDKENDANPIKTHHHEKVDFLFFQNVQVLFFVLLICMPLAPNKQISKIHFTYLRQFNSQYFASQKGRGPPAPNSHSLLPL